MSRRRFVISAATMSAVLAAGMPAIRAVAAQDAADYPELMLVATDYAFEMPGTAESGFTRLTLDNQGAEDHHAIFLRLNDGVTMEDFQAALMSGDLGALLAVSSAYGGPLTGIGQTSSVVAFLDPGMYMVICVVPDAQGVPHAAHGMVAPLEVTEGANAAEAPEADGTISLVEMAFDGLPSEVAAGSYTWEVINNGAQLHEIGVLKLAPGVTPDMFMAMMTAPPDAGAATPDAGAMGDHDMATPGGGEAMGAASPEAAGAGGEAGAAMEGPPFELIAGAAPMSPGATNFFEIDLEAGEFVAICFVPDVETGMPHFMMGMIAGFTVT